MGIQDYISLVCDLLIEVQSVPEGQLKLHGRNRYEHTVQLFPTQLASHFATMLGLSQVLAWGPCHWCWNPEGTLIWVQFMPKQHAGLATRNAENTPGPPRFPRRECHLGERHSAPRHFAGCAPISGLWCHSRCRHSAVQGNLHSSTDNDHHETAPLPFASLNRTFHTVARLAATLCCLHHAP